MKFIFRNVHYFHGIYILVLSLLVQNSYGNSIDSDTTSIQIKSANRFALQFQIKENFKFDDFQGSLISAKYHLNEKHGLRFGIEIFGDLKKSDNIHLFESNASNSSDPYLDEADVSIHFILQYLNISKMKKRVQRYMAIGPLFGYNHTVEETGYESSSGDIAISKDTIDYSSSSIVIGLAFNIGLEYYLNENIGLMAEYGIRLIYNKQDCDMVRPDRGEYYYKDFIVGADGFKLGCSVYF